MIANKAKAHQAKRARHELHRKLKKRAPNYKNYDQRRRAAENKAAREPEALKTFLDGIITTLEPEFTELKPEV